MNGILLPALVLSLAMQNIVIYPEQTGEMNSYISHVKLSVDEDYLYALRTADGFLHAWALRNFEEGVNFLSENLRESVTPEWIKSYFSEESNPHHMAYEICGAKYVNKNTIRFNVWLYEYEKGQIFDAISRPKPQYIDVIRIGKELWLVNNFPENYE
jgi:hypothetical protein